MQYINKVTLTARINDPKGNTIEYVFPNVELNIEPDIKKGSTWSDGFMYHSEPDTFDAMKITGWAFRSDDNDMMIMNVKKKEKESTVPLAKRHDSLHSILVGLAALNSYISVHTRSKQELQDVDHEVWYLVDRLKINELALDNLRNAEREN